MRDAARTLASYGRNGDDMLVHVSRKELEGIRALTGRDFTRNPDTGLPEAFNFASLLPIAAGIGASILTGGAAAPLVGAAASGVTSAGLAAARGASAQDALTQGLISGATSYAGGQLLAGVGDAAGAAAGGAGDAAAQSAASSAANPGALSYNLGDAAGSANNAVLSAAGSNPGAMAYNAGAVTPPAPAPAAAAAPQTIGERASAFGTRLSNIASDPGAAISKIGENISNNKFSALIAGGGMLSQANDMFGNQRRMPGEPEYDPNRYPEQFPTTPRSFTPPPAGYRPGAGPEYRYFAEGGLASVRKDEGYTANVMNEAKAALLGEHPRPREAIARFREAFGDEALNLLRDRISPGRVRGAGGGMDDLVPGSIEGRQKVRLADGEFVVPADVVSGLGDGSTDQGVRKLHGLMDKVRQQRTGMKAQPKAIGGKITL
jgi:hypothetical protein